MKVSKVMDSTLQDVRDKLPPNKRNSKEIAKELNSRGFKLHHSTVRQRFIDMGEPLGGTSIKPGPMPTPTKGEQMEEQVRTEEQFKFATGTQVIVGALPKDSTILPGINDEMRALTGKKFTVSDRVEDHRGKIYSLEETEWAFREDWLEEVKVQTKRTLAVAGGEIDDTLKAYIPNNIDFEHYVERPQDLRLSMHLDLQASGRSNKYPLCQGPQGTGKTHSGPYYAMKKQIPYLCFSCYEDFKLPKLFGDKTIEDGSIKFVESLFTKAIQSPSLICFDEINAVSQPNTYDFHALLQNRELFIPGADEGKGKIYKLHPACRIMFTQNPKSKKYIGGNVRASNFLGRCTYITYDQFSTKELDDIITKAHPDLEDEERRLFIMFYQAVHQAIEKSDLPVDISLRQLNNIIDLYMAGFTLKEAINDGMLSIVESISQPTAKEPLLKLAEATWSDLNVRRV